jgi:hypothetical protein
MNLFSYVQANVLDDDSGLEVQTLEGVSEMGDFFRGDHDLGATADPGGDPEVESSHVHERSHLGDILEGQVPGLQDLITAEMTAFTTLFTPENFNKMLLGI